jgi:hypothetical protein
MDNINNKATLHYSFENAAKFENLGTTAKNQNLNHKEAEIRLNLADACHHPVQKLVLSSAA